jgi:hypothetical protein
MATTILRGLVELFRRRRPPWRPVALVINPTARDEEDE